MSGLGAPSILIVHRERKIQRMIQRVLGGADVRFDVTDNVEHARQLLAQIQPVLVVTDGAMDVRTLRGLIEAATACGAETCVTLLGGASAQVAALLAMGAVTNLLVHPMPVLADALTITAQKLVRNDLFGAEKYLLWGTTIRETTLVRSSQRHHVIDQVAEQVRASGQSARVSSMAMLVTDELLSNAIHNAPVDAAGEHYRKDLPRDGELQLDARHQVRLRWGCDARHLAIEVSDQFGSLDRETILGSLARTNIRDSGGGAGMGVALAYRSCDHLVFNLARGARTEIIALIDVRYPPTERISASSYNVFVERPRS